MSVGMRWPIGENNDLITDFGIVKYPQPRPELDEVGPLMLAPASWIKSLCNNGPTKIPTGGTAEVIMTKDSRTFIHYAYGDNHWVWEMFETHFEPDSPHQGTMPMMIGRWPD